jgi:hypothetical protein
MYKQIKTTFTELWSIQDEIVLLKILSVCIINTWCITLFLKCLFFKSRNGVQAPSRRLLWLESICLTGSERRIVENEVPKLK